MPPKAKVYIAGVGLSPLPRKSSSNDNSVAPLVSAATKALLDAGITYDDISQGVRSKQLSQGLAAFKAFDETEIPIDAVEDGSELDSAFQHVQDQGAQSVLTIVTDQSYAVSLVLVSEDFLWRHPYLKDSSALIHQSSSSEQAAKTKLQDICQTAWILRGWSDSSDSKQSSFSYKGKSSKTYELSRADAGEIPKWKDVEHKHDGKYRLRYNPASDTKEISQEDFEAVRASGKDQKLSKNAIKFERKGGDRAVLAKL